MITRTCALIQNQLLGLPTVQTEKLPDSIQSHLLQCAACRGYLEQITALEDTIRGLPVEPSDPAIRQEFLAKLQQPIILPKLSGQFSSPQSSSVRSVRILRGEASRWIAAGLAAVMLLGWLTTAFWRGQPNADSARRPLAARHELLQQEVALLTELAKASQPSVRVNIWSDYLQHLHQDTQQLAHAGDPQLLDAVAGMYDRAARDGLSKQARLIPETWTRDQRLQALARIEQNLVQMETQSREAYERATARARPALLQIADRARTTREQVQAVIRGDDR